MKESLSNRYKAGRIIAIVAFSLIMAALLTAIINDGVLFASQIFGFIFATFASIMAFLIAIILMVVSCVFVFGIYILSEKGFWPYSWATNVFKTIIADYQMSSEQLQAFMTIRIVLLVVCALAFVLSIVGMVFNKKSPLKLPKVFDILALIFSILGVFGSIIMMIIIKVIA